MQAGASKLDVNAALRWSSLAWSELAVLHHFVALFPGDGPSAGRGLLIGCTASPLRRVVRLYLLYAPIAGVPVPLIAARCRSWHALGSCHRSVRLRFAHLIRSILKCLNLFSIHVLARHSILIRRALLARSAALGWLELMRGLRRTVRKLLSLAAIATGALFCVTVIATAVAVAEGGVVATNGVLGACGAGHGVLVARSCIIRRVAA